MKQLKRIATALSLCASVAVHAGEFRLFSSDLSPDAPLSGEHVFNGFGCSGKNVSPVLNWEGVPPGTQSIALTVYDPDAPTGSGWWHWVVVNIPAGQTGLTRGAGNPGGKLPKEAKQVRTDFGSPGYGGACPPEGDNPHRYIFSAYALKVPSIDLPDNATAALAGFFIHANMIEKATLVVTYGR